MDNKEKYVQTAAPMLFPIEPEQFWQMLRILVREEVNRLSKPGEAPYFKLPDSFTNPCLKLQRFANYSTLQSQPSTNGLNTGN